MVVVAVKIWRFQGLLHERLCSDHGLVGNVGEMNFDVLNGAQKRPRSSKAAASGIEDLSSHVWSRFAARIPTSPAHASRARGSVYYKTALPNLCLSRQSHLLSQQSTSSSRQQVLCRSPLRVRRLFLGVTSPVWQRNIGSSEYHPGGRLVHPC
mgnify:CR=1 FL=1